MLERHETGGRRRGVRALRPGLPGLLRRRGRLDDDGNLVYGYDVGDRHMVALHFYCELGPRPVTCNGCAGDSPQENYLGQDLESSNYLNTLANRRKPYALAPTVWEDKGRLATLLTTM